jgi:hypothetical protein
MNDMNDTPLLTLPQALMMIFYQCAKKQIGNMKSSSHALSLPQQRFDSDLRNWNPRQLSGQLFL